MGTSCDELIGDAIADRQFRAALELLARSYGPPIGRLCMAMLGDQAEAEELTQEILLDAHAAMPAFEGRASVRTWFYSIARRSCSRQLRKRTRRAELMVKFLPPTADEASLRAVTLSAERHQLRRALDALSIEQHEILLLRYVGDLSFREVADVCDIKEAAARQRACGAIRKLREIMLDVKEASPAPFASCQEATQ